MYYDIHTHHPTQNDTTISIENIDLYSHNTLNINNLCSIGLHPWHVNHNWEIHFPTLISALKNEKMVAIGECGLDKLKSNADFGVQKLVFEQQLLLAQKHQKPVIIHCVRAHEEMMAMKRQLKLDVPLIIHGFNQKLDIGKAFLKAGFYLSLGTALLRDGSNAKAILRHIPLENILLETDDDAENGIEFVYIKAAHLLNISLETFILQLEKNVQRIFQVKLVS